jgi:DnaJ-class molecular chaperone
MPKYHRGSETPKLSAKPAEHKCPACKGTGFPAVKQPAEPGRKIYPARCSTCDGKGRIRKAAK